MEIWNGKEWIIMDDFTSAEWDEFENFESLVERESDYIDIQAGLDEVVDRMMCDPKFHDEIVGWF
jgi:hypothetical protein